MSDGEKRCEACGGKTTGQRLTGEAGNNELDPKNADMKGAAICSRCAIAYGHDWEECYGIIRARRSAPPAVASDDCGHASYDPGCRVCRASSRHPSGVPIGAASGPLSAEGRPIAVGDRLRHKCTNRVIVANRIDCDDVRGPVQYEAGDPLRMMDKEGETRDAARCWIHLAPIAAPPGGEKAKGMATVDCTWCGAPKKEGVECKCRRAVAAPQPTLAAFTAAVHEHLLPRLPKDFKAITDVVHGGRFALWVLDEKGREVWERDYSGDELPSAVVIASGAVDVACEIMHRMSRAAENPRGGGR